MITCNPEGIMFLPKCICHVEAGVFPFSFSCISVCLFCLLSVLLGMTFNLPLTCLIALPPVHSRSTAAVSKSSSSYQSPDWFDSLVVTTLFANSVFFCDFASLWFLPLTDNPISPRKASSSASLLPHPDVVYYWTPHNCLWMSCTFSLVFTYIKLIQSLGSCLHLLSP